jgi:hypothetical protein
LTPASGNDFAYRALTKERIPTDKSFRLRPNEPTLSIALTEEKAIGTLQCKGIAKMSLTLIRAICGLAVQVKIEGQLDPANPDRDFLEILGLPLFESEDDQAKTDFAMALLGTVIESRPLGRRY